MDWLGWIGFVALVVIAIPLSVTLFAVILYMLVMTPLAILMVVGKWAEKAVDWILKRQERLEAWWNRKTIRRGHT